jgi:hypothetical protein
MNDGLRRPTPALRFAPLRCGVPLYASRPSARAPWSWLSRAVISIQPAALPCTPSPDRTLDCFSVGAAFQPRVSCCRRRQLSRRGRRSRRICAFTRASGVRMEDQWQGANVVECPGKDRGWKAAPTGRAFGGEGMVVDGKESGRAVESPGSRPRARPSCGPKAEQEGSGRLTRNALGKAREWSNGGRAVESPGSRPRARPSCGPKAERTPST